MRLLVLFLLAVTLLVSAPVPKKKGAVSIPQPFRAIPGASQAIQNRQADKDGLSRLRDKDLAKFKKSGLLVPLPKIQVLEAKDLGLEWQFVRPWTAEFLSDFARTYRKKFPRETLFVTSAIRTVERQRELRGENANATKATGKRASSHETGATVDITKNGMTRDQVYWVRRVLRPLHGKTIYVVEERRQPCFHIMVYKNYKKPQSW